MIEALKDEKLSSRDIIRNLKSIEALKKAYETTVRHYVLEKHTILVIDQFDKYFSNKKLFIGRSLFRLLLALHDVGKPRAFEEGDKGKQYEYTLDMIEQVRGFLPFKKNEVDLCKAILRGDPIGEYFQNKIALIKAKRQITRQAHQAEMDPNIFLKILTIYYQCDIASYTADGGGFHFLEHLFLYLHGGKVFEESSGLLRFSPIFETKYSDLEKVIINE